MAPKRSSHKPGVVYTPEAEARRMCRTALLLYLRDKPPEAVHSLTVFDPACGTGELLAAMLKELVALGADAQRAIANLYGMDIDPEAVHACRDRLGGGHIDCGDTLFERVDKFDLVIGNPPYIDSETMVRTLGPEYRQQIAAKYACARGNWDLYIPFLERGIKLLKPGGVLVYITPDKWLGKPFGDAFRAKYLPNIVSIEPVGRDVFADALVDSIITVISASKSKSLQAASRTVDKSNIAAPYTLDYLLSDHLDFIRQIEAMPGRLGNFGTCQPTCATSDAYKLVPLVREGARGYKLVNTGTIAKFTTHWGIRPMKYLGKEYQNPVCSKIMFHRMFPHSYGDKIRFPKIIIKGLNRLDAMPDFKAEYLPAKTTLIFHSEHRNNLLFALGVINSDLMQKYVNEKYRGHSYNGGVTFTKEMITQMPVPSTKKSFTRIVKKVRQILKSPENPALQQELNALIDKLYLRQGSGAAAS